MTTSIRPEISKQNRYWISRHRYYELKHFCLQYPEWKKNYNSLITIHIKPLSSIPIRTSPISNPTEQFAEARIYFKDRMDMVEKASIEAAGILHEALLEAVTNGVSYECLNAREILPCSKDVWYIAYRRFFWLLDKARK